MEELHLLMHQLNHLTKRFEAHQQEWQRVRNRERWNLEQLLRRMQPLISFVGDPIRVEVTSFGEALNRQDDILFYEENGILLYNRFSRTKDIGGEYAGTQLWYTQSGKLIEIERTGDTNFTPDGVSHWCSEVRELTRDEVLDSYPMITLFRAAFSNLEKAEDALNHSFDTMREYEKTLDIIEAEFQAPVESETTVEPRPTRTRPRVKPKAKPDPETAVAIAVAEAAINPLAVLPLSPKLTPNAPIELSEARLKALEKAREAKRLKREQTQLSN